MLSERSYQISSFKRLSGRRLPASRHVLLWWLTGAVGVFLLAPVLVVVVFSTNSEPSLHHYGQPSLRWFVSAFTNDGLLSSAGYSLQIAALTAVVATILGTLLAFGLARASSRWVAVPNTVVIATLVTPEIATGVSLFVIFAYGFQLPLSMGTVTAAHITFSIVYVTLVVRTRLAGLPPVYEEAARDLGCTQLQAIRYVVLPHLAPAIIGSALLTFVLSFDDFITSTFTTGPGTSPLPVYIYSRLKFGLTPEINALGTTMLILTVAIGVVGILLVHGPSKRNRTTNADSTRHSSARTH